MKGVRWLLCALSFSAALVLQPKTATESAAARPAVEGPLSQWVWTQRDVKLHRQAQRQAHVGAAPLVATLRYRDGQVRWRRGLSPAAVACDAVVVRLDDSLHAAWADRDDDEMARLLAEPLAETLAEVAAARPGAREIQLDYDAPVRRLPRWAALVKRLRRDVLAGRSVWLTSIPAHVQRRDYGELFRGAADGHILQLFDTGWRCNERHLQQLHALLQRHRLAFRIGVGAFERGTSTDHGCWLHNRHAFRDIDGFSGVWVFPAGRPYLPHFQ